MSPILAARRGSAHGYDVIDPTRLNPELGGDAELRALAAELTAHRLGLIVDIVPNHMGIGAENPFWDDVLTRGERSRYASWFDIDWHAGGRRVTLPVLDDTLARVIERCELALRPGPGRKIRLFYGGQSFPLDPETVPPELQLAQMDRHIATEVTESFRREPGHPRLHALVRAQHYRLASWREEMGAVNYRHFFDVVDLAAVRVEEPAVFDETHALLLRLVADGVIDGVRVDHVDGLRNPRDYLAQLRDRLDATGRSPLLFVEKVLEPGEELRDSWPVDGTTGYEFLNTLQDVFIEPGGFAEIERTYRRMRHLRGAGFADAARAGKLAVLVGAFRADVDRLVAIVGPLAADRAPALTNEMLGDGVREIIASLAVYRTYLENDGEVHDADRAAIDRAVADVQARERPSHAVRFIADLLLGRIPADDDGRSRAFIERFQQLSGPAMAKGVEDTALYAYLPLASRNEVGGAPDRPLDEAVAALHAVNTRRAARWPLSLTCTMTHDSKRSGDVRARLDALSEMPAEWERTVRRWRRLNAKRRTTVRGRIAPDTNTEYLLYQTLVALWPSPRPGRRVDDLPDRAWRDALAERLDCYMLKAAREAKTRTDWTQPDAAYESALSDFTAALLEPADDAPFLVDLARLVSRVAPVGAVNALSSLVLQMTSPGTPDVYQGDELPTFALVDPDNRRPVDYDTRRTLLDALPACETALGNVCNAALKLWVTHRLLCARRTHADLFARGSYRPLAVAGERAAHIASFARSCGAARAITVAPRLIAELVLGDVPPERWWGDTRVELPSDLSARQWRNIFGGTTDTGQTSILVGPVFANLPFAVLLAA